MPTLWRPVTLFSLMALLAAFNCTRAEAFKATLAVTATDPVPPVTFGQKGGVIYLRIQYQTDTPIKIFATGLRTGREVRDGYNNPSPLYSSGSGEAFCWFAENSGAVIDEIRIEAHAFGLIPLTTISIPFQANWTSSEPTQARIRQPWVLELEAAQSRALNEEHQRASTGWIHLVAIIAGGVIMLVAAGSVIVYVPLQAYAIRKLTGPHLFGAIVTGLIMAGLITHAVYAYRAGAGLWPIFLIFGSPVAVAYLLWAVLRARKAEKATTRHQDQPTAG